MGNVAMACGGRPGGSEPVEPRVPVTVLQLNGNVLSLYSSRVRVVDLILDYPNHFVCHSSSLVQLHHSKILPLHTLLVPGEVYFLLPMPNRHTQDNESDTSSLLHIEPPRRAVHHRSGSTGSTKFVISTEQFSHIMAGSIKEGKQQQGGALSSSVKRNRHHGRSSSGKTTTTTKSMSSSGSNSITAPIAAPWRPALSSIEEVAAN